MLSLTAVGGEFNGLMFTKIKPVSHNPSKSHALYCRVSMPSKLKLGVYLKAFVALTFKATPNLAEESSSQL